MTEPLRFRVHGDNVVECERALSLIAQALELSPVWKTGSIPQAPTFGSASNSLKRNVEIQLLPGHGRWGIDIAAVLRTNGSPLRENADAVITEVLDGGHEEMLLAIEFCGALPAGNNAWQRQGRAFGFGLAGVPYLIYTEIGGLELTASRDARASRLPNPAVPFSLVQFSKDVSETTLPVYEPAPSAPAEVRKTFMPVFSGALGIRIVGESLTRVSSAATLLELEHRTLEMVRLLCERRVRSDGFGIKEWRDILETNEERLTAYVSQNVKWSRRSSEKVQATSTAAEFLSLVASLDLVALGTSSLPFAVLNAVTRMKLAEGIEEIYETASEPLVSWLRSSPESLVLVFVTGFKPRGDDSRPDRGLAPLARMLAGPSSDLMTFLWGPAKHGLLTQLKTNPTLAAASNGLIESILACSNGVLVDSITAEPFSLTRDKSMVRTRTRAPAMKSTMSIPTPGEHDVDSVFHFLLKNPVSEGVFESMCNPPGGDWSGISLLIEKRIEVRWTSLPRVSSSSAKRPDHVVQFSHLGQDALLSVESKQSARYMEEGVGPRLIRYLRDLLKSQPNAERADGDNAWQSYESGVVPSSDISIFSVGLFVFNRIEELASSLIFSDLDVVGAFEFGPEGEVILHVRCKEESQSVLDALVKMVRLSSVNVKVSED